MLDQASATTADLWARAERAIPGGVNSATRRIGRPLVIERARGAHVWDADGRRFIDYHAAFGATLLGHADPVVGEAVARTLVDQDLVGMGVSRLEIECAELVNAMIPSADKTILTMSGTESTFQAIRLARGVTGRDLIVKFQGCFHGWHDAVSRNVISTPEKAYGMDPTSSGILAPNLEATLIAEFNDLASVQELFARHKDRIAAVILEPIPHNIGALLPDQAFLEGLRALTEEEGALLIFDEVITGFRHAPGGYQEICGVMPDLTTYGKAMGNGFPVAGMSGRADLMDQFSSAGGSVLLAGTFNGGPASTAAAIATLTHLRTTDFHQRVFALGDRLRAGLAAITEDLGIEACVTGYGSVVICYFMPMRPKGYRDLLEHHDDKAYAEFHRRMYDHDILMLPMSLKRNHITGAHTAEDVDQTIDAARVVLTEMAHEGLVGA
ncbi:aspartate aminotransferase family protein [Roseisalinus antarcticus]|uniref:Glutamate-1-semialdehyde 2,1-aminomutase n=1 Tax=Roseisalinus antarcticus TaxID=254357 RepID=A0A1Y5TTC8_9RHOB|nr:aspartate aminotransferase family protein [Roseisalinus antarcticus]SLN72132.1 Glutamate-1-semialdehyde 2,1-aminomutase [Roseisalinus antarcticus]